MGLLATNAKNEVIAVLWGIAAVITFVSASAVARSQRVQGLAALARVLTASKINLADICTAARFANGKSEGTTAHPWLTKRVLETAASRFPGALLTVPSERLRLLVLELLRSGNTYSLAALRRLVDFRNNDVTLHAVKLCVQADEPGLAAFLAGMGGNNTWRSTVHTTLLLGEDQNPVYEDIRFHLMTGTLLEDAAMEICARVRFQAPGSSTPSVPSGLNVPTMPPSSTGPRRVPIARIGPILAICGIAVLLLVLLTQWENARRPDAHRTSQVAEATVANPASGAMGQQPTKQHVTPVHVTQENPCAKARAAELGEPLSTAMRAAEKKSVRAADSAPFQEAVRSAKEAVGIAPACAEAWSFLAYAQYRLAYDICGRGEYGAAQVAVQKALSLDPEPKTRAAALRNVARIAAARLKWDEAEGFLTESLAVDSGSHEARTWLDDMRMLRQPRPEFMAAVTKVLSGEPLAEDDVRGLTAAEDTGLANATLARSGRRLNYPVADWFFFCEGSPVEDRPELDIEAVRTPMKRGTTDFANMELVTAARRRLRAGDGPGTTY